MSGGAGAHTPEPWVAENGGGRGAWICGATKEWSALSCGDSDQSAEANAARIVACVNALAGIPTDQLSTLMGEVRAIVEDMAKIIDVERSGYFPYTLETARALLAKLPVQP